MIAFLAIMAICKQENFRFITFIAFCCVALLTTSCSSGGSGDQNTLQSSFSSTGWVGFSPDEINRFLFPAFKRVIYLDNTLETNCLEGNYSSTSRNCSGADGIAVRNPEDLFSHRDGEATVQLLPGDRIIVRGGVYNESSESNSNRPMFTLEASGTLQEPITIVSAPGETVVFNALGEFSEVFYVTGNYLVFDGLQFTMATENGFFADEPLYIVIRNCIAFNNSTSLSSSSAGFVINGGSHVVIESSQATQNASGILLTAPGWPSTDAANNGTTNFTLQNNSCIDNSQTSNFGNADGIVARFSNRGAIRGNTASQNPDGGIDALGITNVLIEQNTIFDNFIPPGNGEGIKLCVRGGGGNLVRYNLVYNNERGIQDNCFGDIIHNNTVANNNRWGIVADQWSRHTLFYNNASFGNGTSDAFQSSKTISSSELVDRTQGEIFSDNNFYADGNFFWLDAGDHEFTGDPAQAVSDPSTPDALPTSNSLLINSGKPIEDIASIYQSQVSNIVALANQFASDSNWTNCPNSICNTSASQRNRAQAAINWLRLTQELQGSAVSYQTPPSNIHDLFGASVSTTNPIDVGALSAAP